MKRLMMTVATAALLAGCGNGGKTVRYADLKDRDVMVRAGEEV